MRSSETSALFTRLLRQHRGVAIGELHGQTSSLEFMIRHLDLFAREGVKYIGTESFQGFQQEDLNCFFKTGEISSTLRRQIRMNDLDSVLSDMRPTMGQHTRTALIHRWLERDPTLGNAELRILDNWCEQAATHPYSFESLLQRSRDHGIRIWGINFKAASNATRLGEVNNFVAQSFGALQEHGKVILHTGGSHLKSCEGAEGICDQLDIPAIGIYDSAMRGVHLVAEGEIQPALIHRQSYVVSHDVIIHGTPLPMAFLTRNRASPEPKFDIVDPATQKRIPAHHLLAAESTGTAKGRHNR